MPLKTLLIALLLALCTAPALAAEDAAGEGQEAADNGEAAETTDGYGYEEEEPECD